MNKTSIKEVHLKNLGRFDQDPRTRRFEADNVEALQMELFKGNTALKHVHSYDHLSILAEGKVVVSSDGSEDVIYTAPACITIKKNVHHAVTALEDSLWYCVHSKEVK